MALVELIPIGTFLALLTDQVIKTVQAARDLIQEESFKTLSEYLSNIIPVLEELQRRQLKDSNAARQALEYLEEDVKKANHLVEKCKNCSRFYLLLKCRHIVKEVQDVTRDIGRSLAALSLASTEILSDISDKVNILHNEMQKAEFQASQSQVRIVERLAKGLQEQKSDQNFANDMLEAIAEAVGVPVEPTEINKELESFRREKEEAAERKEQAEVLFLEQVIKLLSRADAANDQEEVKEQYYRRVQTIEKYKQDEYIPPLKSFMCPIEQTAVMVDPVSLCTGTTCERAAIESWIISGQRRDPETGQYLEDLTLRPNVCLRQSIEEWRELNYCLKIRSAKGKLLSESNLDNKEALMQLQELIRENKINKDWIGIEGIIFKIVSLLGSSHDKDVKRMVLITLKAIVDRHVRNKDRLVESGGVDRIVHCLGRDPSISKPAVDLLFDLLQDGSGWNAAILKRVTQQTSSILFLVMLLNGPVTESAEKAETILLKLCDDDDNNISRAANANWYKPLINRLCQGVELSRISMAEVLVKMELVDQNIKLLGEEGAIRPLVEMVSGSLESKKSAFAALSKLSNCRENKNLIASAGGVPLILEQMFSSHVPVPVPAIIRASCSEILEKLSDDGIEFLVDANGALLELERIITDLLAIQQNKALSPSIRKPSLRALLGIYKSEDGLREKAVAAANGVSVILTLLEDADPEIRKLAMNLLFRLAQYEPQGIADFLLVQQRLEAFMDFLKDESPGNIQTAAAGLLAYLPKSEVELTRNLIALGVLPVILNIMKSGTTEAKENALGALFRFTDPANVEMQRMVVEQGAYPLLVSFLRSGTVTAKARAAALIGNLSLSSPKLTAMPKTASFWCFRPSHVPVCEAHGGVCSVQISFCLLEANALPELVRLLQERVHVTALEALTALATLVQEDLPNRGSNVLHNAKAIGPILEVLNWGMPALKEEVLSLLEKVFVAREVGDFYCLMARIPLVALTTQSHEDGQLGRKAARVLALLEQYSRSMPLV
ncbi:U-box domain-containing protein 44-like [Magnolia sinica]|uniref:U-box domain-containing protein 44-like n=1 Tax=Magnolia sinica TaxID=86752 RepID=UPI00265A27FD|nr:U-box domain-containing protein 44-like [Magnolia sinica]XP_058086053.1 U-box domain-containing protein 44-like [Magnolia sinica]